MGWPFNYRVIYNIHINLANVSTQLKCCFDVDNVNDVDDVDDVGDVDDVSDVYDVDGVDDVVRFSTCVRGM